MPSKAWEPVDKGTYLKEQQIAFGFSLHNDKLNLGTSGQGGWSKGTANC